MRGAAKDSVSLISVEQFGHVIVGSELIWPPEENHQADHEIYGFELFFHVNPYYS